MTCAPHEAFIIDEGLPKPDGFDAHVAGCGSCRALKAGHLSALRLTGHMPVRASRVQLGVVLRRASALGALVLLAGGVTGLVALELSASPPGSEEHLVAEAPALPPAPELPVLQVAPNDAESWSGLVDLRAAVAADTERDLRAEPVLRKAFGALPEWVAPTKTYPLRAINAPRFAYTSEDFP